MEGSTGRLSALSAVLQFIVMSAKSTATAIYFFHYPVVSGFIKVLTMLVLMHIFVAQTRGENHSVFPLTIMVDGKLHISDIC